MSTGQHNLRLMQQCTCWCCRNPGYGLSCARSTGESAETSKGLSKTLEGMVERLEKLEGRLPPLGEQDVVTRQLHVALLGLRCDILHTRLTPVRRSSKTTAALRKHLMDKSDKNPVKMSVKRSETQLCMKSRRCHRKARRLQGAGPPSELRFPSRKIQLKE